jgi:hypothetical protein
MATGGECDVALWTPDDCVQFVEKSMKSFQISDKDGILQAVVASFRSNFVTGSALMKFKEEEWRELIPQIGVRVHIRAQFAAKTKEEEIAALSQLHRKGLPKRSQEKSLLVLLARIISLFKPEKATTYALYRYVCIKPPIVERRSVLVSDSRISSLHGQRFKATRSIAWSEKWEEWKTALRFAAGVARKNRAERADFVWDAQQQEGAAKLLAQCAIALSSFDFAILRVWSTDVHHPAEKHKHTICTSNPNHKSPSTGITSYCLGSRPWDGFLA